MAQSKDIFSALDSQLRREIDLFGAKVTVRSLSPTKAVEVINRFNQRAQVLRQSGEGATIEQMVDEEMLKLIASVIADAIVDPPLNPEERERVEEKLNSMPFDRLGELMNILSHVLGTADLSEAIQAAPGETEALFRESQAPVEGQEGSQESGAS